MYAIRDSEGKFVGSARSKAGAHRATRSGGRLGASVNRTGEIRVEYRVIGIGSFMTKDHLIKSLAMHGIKQVGIQSETSGGDVDLPFHPELRSQPKFDKLVGPMWESPGHVYYEFAKAPSAPSHLSSPTGTYSIRYVHKISPRDTDVGPTVRISSADLASKSGLARTLREQKAIGAGARVRDFRVEDGGARIVVFPTMPGMTTYWHSIILTREDR